MEVTNIMNPHIKNLARNILNLNYHTCALSVYLVRSDRKQLIPAARMVQKESKSPLIFIVLKMMVSNFICGCNFWEYYNLRFYNRSLSNQLTFLTTYYNSVLAHKFNSYSDQEILYNKITFNKYFAKYRNIDFISLDASVNEVQLFINKHHDMILKPLRGECGHGVFTICGGLMQKKSLKCTLTT